MLLYFRTKKDSNGNIKFLGIDTENKTYSKMCNTWISKEFPVLSVRDMRFMETKCKEEGYSYSDAFGKTEKIVTVCYGKEEVWDSREKAAAHFLEAMNHSEGSERNRYTNIYCALMDGATRCCDE